MKSHGDFDRLSEHELTHQCVFAIEALGLALVKKAQLFHVVEYVNADGKICGGPASFPGVTFALLRC